MIYAKLLEFQKLGITLKKDGNNPYFESSYVTLNEVLDKVKKPLNDLGVVIVQAPGCATYGEENEPFATYTADGGLWTMLVDTEDKTQVECFVPYVNATDMQKLGGAITYARRYSLITLLGLEDEDDDGNTASAPKETKTTNKPPF